MFVYQSPCQPYIISVNHGEDSSAKREAKDPSKVEMAVKLGGEEKWNTKELKRLFGLAYKVVTDMLKCTTNKGL